jgi:hypothetical protein
MALPTERCAGQIVLWTVVEGNNNSLLGIRGWNSNNVVLSLLWIKPIRAHFRFWVVSPTQNLEK